jgi:hypothetical protein
LKRIALLGEDLLQLAHVSLDQTGTTGALHCSGFVFDRLGSEGVPHRAPTGSVK